MNASPKAGAPWDPHAFYELKLDLNDDFVEEITWRFTFPTDPPRHTVHASGAAQRPGRHQPHRPRHDHHPAQRTVGKVFDVPHGIKVFAGKRLDSFFTDIRVPATLRGVLPPRPRPAPSADPGLGALDPIHDTFAGQTVRPMMVELPARITGLDPIQCWGTAAMFERPHSRLGPGPARRGGRRLGRLRQRPGPLPRQNQQQRASVDLAGRPANPEPTSPRESGPWSGTRSPRSSRS